MRCGRGEGGRVMLEFVFSFFWGLMFDWLFSWVDVQFIAQGFEKLLTFSLDFFSLHGIFTTRLVFWDLCL
jgi:hypothetical protein